MTSTPARPTRSRSDSRDMAMTRSPATKPKLSPRHREPLAVAWQAMNEALRPARRRRPASSRHGLPRRCAPRNDEGGSPGRALHINGLFSKIGCLRRSCAQIRLAADGPIADIFAFPGSGRKQQHNRKANSFM